MGSIVRFTPRDSRSKKTPRGRTSRASDERFRYRADAEPVSEVSCDARGRQRPKKMGAGRANG